ncbi:hypothetical protein ACYATO_08815 [Lactobacillaceae bacterium Melli_B3]
MVKIMDKNERDEMIDYIINCTQANLYKDISMENKKRLKRYSNQLFINLNQRLYEETEAYRKKLVNSNDEELEVIKYNLDLDLTVDGNKEADDYLSPYDFDPDYSDGPGPRQGKYY